MAKKKEFVIVFPAQKIIGKILFISSCGLMIWTAVLSVIKYLMDVSALTPVKTVIWILVLASALAYTFYPLFKGKIGAGVTKGIIKNYFTLDLILLIILIIWSVFSCISMSNTYGNNWFDINKNALLDSVLCFLILFPLGRYIANNGIPTALKWILFSLALILTIFMGYVVVKMCQANVITLPNGNQIGMSSGVRLYINCHPNTTGMYAAVLLTCCLLGAYNSNGFKKFVWIIMCPVHFFIIVLSDSRSAYIAAAVAIAAVPTIEFYSRYKKKQKITIIISAVIFIASFAAIYLAKDLFSRLYEKISHFRELMAISTGTSTTSESAAVSNESYGRGLDSVNARLVVYKYSLKAIVQDVRSFFMGSTPAGVIPMLENVSNNLFSYYTHNQFLEVGVATGVVGLTLFVIWFVRMVIKMFKIFIDSNDIVTRSVRFIIFAVLMLVVANLAEATLLWYEFTDAYLFFVLCGCVYGLYENILVNNK